MYGRGTNRVKGQAPGCELLQLRSDAPLVLDPDRCSASLYRATGQSEFVDGAVLSIPDVLPGFEVTVAKFFE